ncbi:flagellar hook-basal body complex protein FliE [Aureliella helgolandensis]|uniref:Flagellar hook-basal body complex protein FliE n=1 Tax=Aureliella helgolandensis TaxID=2527968 RepID=A0A518GET3_9BACT|nr:flagellar hook-basal body complex protein FliE [Aureliella helgolandensis]QDV27111.1 flagellar hook-basal body protein FliE [Aureliella helgolandensis]
MHSIGSNLTPRMELPLSSRLMHSEAVKQSDRPSSFPDLLMSGVSQVNSMQHDADSQVHEMLTGGDVSQVEVLTAVQKADMAFRMLVQVRNKLMSAYEEIQAIRI